MKPTKHLFKRLSVLLTAFTIFFATISNAANRYAVASGNWSDKKTWSATPGGPFNVSVPVAGDIVYVPGGFTVTLTGSSACNSLTIESGGKLDAQTNTLAVGGNFTNSGTFTGTSYTLTVGGNFENNNNGVFSGTQKITHEGGSNVEAIKTEQRLAKGIYQLEITKPGGEIKVIKVMN